MTNRKIDCFFISPMGEDDSPERQNSDMVIFQLLKPALNPYGFNVDNLRSDQSSTPTITHEMWRRIREDELCIADLTDLNPNVFLECGYRIAVGKPLIALKASGHGDIPFDMRDVRVITYEYFSKENFLKCFDQKKIKETRENLEDQVKFFLNHGFHVRESISVDRLEHIEQILKRIESAVLPNKVDKLIISEVVSPDKDTTKIDIERIN